MPDLGHQPSPSGKSGAILIVYFNVKSFCKVFLHSTLCSAFSRCNRVAKLRSRWWHIFLHPPASQDWGSFSSDRTGSGIPRVGPTPHPPVSLPVQGQQDAVSRVEGFYLQQPRWQGHVSLCCLTSFSPNHHSDCSFKLHAFANLTTVHRASCMTAMSGPEPGCRGRSPLLLPKRITAGPWP